MDCGPKALLTALQACSRQFLLRNKHVCLFLLYGFRCQQICVNTYWLYLFLKTSNGRGSPCHAEQMSIFVLSSHLDLMGDQRFVNISFIFGISGTVPTYGTAYVPTHRQYAMSCRQYVYIYIYVDMNKVHIYIHICILIVCVYTQ